MKNRFSIILVSILCFNIFSAIAFEDLNFPRKNKKDLLFRKSKGDDDDGIKGKFIINAGLGFNSTPTWTALRYAASVTYYSNTYSGSYARIVPKYSSFAPLYNVTVDYGLIKRVSVGVGFGFQSFSVDWYDDNFANSSLTYRDSWTRLAFSVRGDYHIVATKNVALYTGLRFGYNIYSMNNTTAPTTIYPDYKANLGINPTAVAVQAHFGFSYFFGGLVGLNTELALAVGGPYYFSAGIAAKF